jgi:ABC-2 type transport system ATP-binding protein
VTNPAIEATGLTKAYGDLPVLAGVDLRVEPGTVFALLGPNGAGKTTTVRILATLAEPDSGQATVAGFDVVRQRRQVRRAISLTGQHAALDEPLTGQENLWLMGRLAGLSRQQARSRAAELLAEFDLTEAGTRRVSTYSGGMRRRLDLAAGLVGHPSVIFLDEPTTGLDPRSRQAMWQVITGLVGTGVTVFLTTQYLEEADQLADRIAVVDAGHVVAEGTPAQLKGQVAGRRLDITLVDHRTFAEVSAYLGDRAVHRDPERDTVGVPTDGSAAHLRAVLDEVDPRRAAVLRVEGHDTTLDDVFLALTGHRADPTTAKEQVHV